MESRQETRDVSAKPTSLRSAKASARLSVAPATIGAIRSGNVPKADPLGVARVAAIQAAKNTSLLIPYCHQVPLDYIGVDIRLEDSAIAIGTEVKAVWKTGVEMEALVAASAAALALYDMLKIIDDRMEIGAITLVEKKGGKSDRKVPAPSVRAAVLVLSDSVSEGKAEDRSGKLLAELLGNASVEVVSSAVLPDDRTAIESNLKRLADTDRVDLIVTTGGTGLGPRDVTPEATLAVIDRNIPGIEEAMRSYGQDRLQMAMLSRAVVGVRGRTLIVNLPGSPGGVRDGFTAIFPAVLHVFRMMKGEKH